MWTTACLTANFPTIATLADALSPSFIGYGLGNNLDISYLNFGATNRMPHDSLYVLNLDSPTAIQIIRLPILDQVVLFARREWWRMLVKSQSQYVCERDYLSNYEHYNTTNTVFVL